MTMQAFLQHGSGTSGPFQTEAVPMQIDEMEWQKAGLSYTASGYGHRIPTQYKVKWLGRWRRVYCRIFSNSGTCYIRTSEAESGEIAVSIDN